MPHREAMVTVPRMASFPAPAYAGSAGEGHIRVLWGQLRHGPGPTGALALAGTVAASAVGLLPNPGWAEPRFDDWYTTAARISCAVSLFGLAVTAFLGCYTGIQHRRSNTGWLRTTAARRALPCTLLGLAPAVVWPLIGYALAAGLLAARTAWEIGPSTVPCDSFCYDMALLVACSCLAYMIGLLLPHRLAIVGTTVGAVGYDLGVSENLGLRLEPGPALYSGPLIPQYEYAHFTDPTVRSLVLTALFLGLAAAVVAALARAWRMSLVLCAGTAVAVVCATTAEPVHRPWQSHHTRLTCTIGMPHLCTVRGREADADRFREAAQQIETKLTGVRGAPTHYLFHPISYTSSADSLTTDSVSWTITLSDDDPSYQIEDATERIACVGGGDCDMTARTAVREWLLPASRRDLDQLPGVRRLVALLDALPRTERAAWLTCYLDAVKGGKAPPAIPAPSKASIP